MKMFVGALMGALLVSGAAVMGPQAQASEPTPYDAYPSPTAPQFRVTPYAWLTNLNGDMTVRGQDVGIDASFIDIVQESDSLMAFMLNAEMRKGPFSFYSDTVYANLTASNDTLGGGGLSPGLTISANADAEFQLFIQELGLMYELFRGPRFADGSQTAIDLVAGGRYWNIQAELELGVTGGGPLPPGLQPSGGLAIADGGTQDWFDPLIGLRARHQLGPGQELFARADVGGFGVGSDISWNLIAGYSWDCRCQVFGADMHGLIGYRGLYADYSDGTGSDRFAWDMWVHGPAMAVSFKF